MTKRDILTGLVLAAQPEFNRQYDERDAEPDLDALNSSEKIALAHIKKNGGSFSETEKFIAALMGLDLEELAKLVKVKTFDSVPKWAMIVPIKNPNGNGYELDKAYLVGPATGTGDGKFKAIGVDGMVGPLPGAKGHSTMTRQMDSLRPATMDEVVTFVANVDLNGTDLSKMLDPLFADFVAGQAKTAPDAE